MLQLQLMLGLFIGLQLNIVDRVAYAITENEISSVNQNDVLNLTAFDRTLFGQPDFSINERLITTNSTEFPNPEELGTYLEGDLLIPINDEMMRNGMLAKSFHWTGGIVPYVIRGNFTARERTVISHAFSQYKARTCIQFRPRKSERDYITIENKKTGCWSSVGRLGGQQFVNLQSRLCLWKNGTAMHELAHAIGFLHEHSRHDRDAYVSVRKENVMKGKMVNFVKSTSKSTSGFGVPYDYASVLHYSPTSFSKNDKPTLVALRNTTESELMGQRNGFSQGDIDKINAMYRCKKSKKKPVMTAPCLGSADN